MEPCHFLDLHLLLPVHQRETLSICFISPISFFPILPIFSRTQRKDLADYTDPMETSALWILFFRTLRVPNGRVPKDGKWGVSEKSTLTHHVTGHQYTACSTVMFATVLCDLITLEDTKGQERLMLGYAVFPGQKARCYTQVKKKLCFWHVLLIF